jgi:HD-like signal output (HDOD) protein
MNDKLLQRIKQCPSLPSLPSIAMQVLDLAQKADVDIAEIARIISKDPALSGKILRTVNSSFYGRSQHVSTISHALVILGLQSVKTLVLGFSLVTNLQGLQAHHLLEAEHLQRDGGPRDRGQDQYCAAGRGIPCCSASGHRHARA